MVENIALAAKSRERSSQDGAPVGGRVRVSFAPALGGTDGFDHAFVLHFSHLVVKPPYPDMEWRHGFVFSSSCAWTKENICVIIVPL